MTLNIMIAVWVIGIVVLALAPYLFKKRKRRW